MMEATIAVPNAILFVLDPGNKDVSVPEYSPDEATAANATCVSIRTLAEVDGDVLVRIEHPRTAWTSNPAMRVFDGKIETPGKIIAIVTSLFERILETHVQGCMTRISSSVNDPDAPSVVTLRVG